MAIRPSLPWSRTDSYRTAQNIRATLASRDCRLPRNEGRLPCLATNRQRSGNHRSNGFRHEAAAAAISGDHVFATAVWPEVYQVSFDAGPLDQCRRSGKRHDRDEFLPKLPHWEVAPQALGVQLETLALAGRGHPNTRCALQSTVSSTVPLRGLADDGSITSRMTGSPPHSAHPRRDVDSDLPGVSSRILLCRRYRPCLALEML
jgi:hypothetical protein